MILSGRAIYFDYLVSHCFVMAVSGALNCWLWYTDNTADVAEFEKQMRRKASLSESALINFGEYLILKVKQWVECR